MNARLLGAQKSSRHSGLKVVVVCSVALSLIFNFT